MSVWSIRKKSASGVAAAGLFLLTAKLSQMPLEILASVLAEQGATKTKSAHLRSSICRIGSPLTCQDYEVYDGEISFDQRKSSR